MDRRNTVGDSSPSQPSEPLRPSRDERFGDPYVRRERSPDTYRGNERESAYRGRGPTYGRRDGEVRGPGDGGSAIYGPGRFSTPVDPWDESRAATET